MTARLLCACHVALLLLLAPQAGLGQTRGNTVPVVDHPIFRTVGQSLWGPGQRAGPIDVKVNLVSRSWNESGSEGDIRSIEGFNFGGRIEGATDGLIEITARLAVPGAGRLDVTYPVRVELRIPEPNSFRDGEEIMIRSGYGLLEGGSIATTPPESEFELAGRFALRASSRVRICVFSCDWTDLFPAVDFGTSEFTVLTMSSNDQLNIPVPGVAPHTLLPHTFGPIETMATGLSGTVDLPRFPAGTTMMVDRSLRTVESHRFIDIGVDLDSYLNKFFPLLPPLGQQSTGFGSGVRGGYEILDASMPVRFTQSHEMEFTPNLQVEFVLPRAVPYRITDEAGNPVTSGTSDRIRFAVGHSLHLTFPAGLRTPLAVASRFQLDNEFSARSKLEFGAGFTQKVAELSLNVPRQEVIPRICVVDECTPAVYSPSFNLSLGPLFEASQPLAPTHSTLFPSAPSDCTPGTEGCGRWMLEGFDPIAGTLFALDPEDPVILVSTSIVSGLATHTGAAGTLTQTVTVTNGGDVTLSLVQVANALTAQFAGAGLTVNSVTSITLDPNSGFDGVGARNTLVGSDALPVGGSGVITVNFSVTPGNVYHSAVSATGRSPIDTDVAAETSARFAVFTFEFHPSQVLEPGSGIVPAIIRGTAELDARQIVLASIRLDGIAPTSTREQNGPVWNVALQFDRNAIWQAARARIAGGMAVAGAGFRPAIQRDVAELAQAVLAGTTGLTLGDLRARVLDSGSRAGGGMAQASGQAPPGILVVLPVTGELLDGTPFVGEATIIVSEGT